MSTNFAVSPKGSNALRSFPTRVVYPSSFDVNDFNAPFSFVIADYALLSLRKVYRSKSVWVVSCC